MQLSGFWVMMQAGWNGGYWAMSRYVLCTTPFLLVLHAAQYLWDVTVTHSDLLYMEKVSNFIGHLDRLNLMSSPSITVLNMNPCSVQRNAKMIVKDGRNMRLPRRAFNRSILSVVCPKTEAKLK